MAAGLIASGACTKILLLAGDASYIPRPTNNRIIAPIFGDGGSASLLTRTAGACLTFELGTDGSGYRQSLFPEVGPLCRIAANLKKTGLFSRTL